MRKSRLVSLMVPVAIGISSSFSTFCNAQDYYRPPVSYHPGHSNNIKDTIKRTSYFFSFDIGLSVPLRDFGTKDSARNFMIIGPDSTNGKGFANLGFHGSVTGGVYITPQFGLCAKIAYNENTFDETALNAIVNGSYTYSINSNFSIWQYMGGVFFNFPTDKYSSVWIQVMIGDINANFPSFSIYNIPGAPYLSWNFTLANANDLAYMGSIGYEKTLSRNVSFVATLSYTASQLVYPTLSYNLTGPYTNLPPTYTQHTPVTMSFGSLDFGIGLLFHL